jgi:phage shock protein A
MSSILKRMSLIFKAKANKALDAAEDPRETLDYSYTQMQEMLTKMRRGVADVATSRKRVELQAQQLRQSSAKLQTQAQRALAAGREDLAREALTRKSGVDQQMTDLQSQAANLQTTEDKLVDNMRRLQAKIESFRTQKETIKAQYTAAEAETKVNEAFSGVSEEMGDVGMAIDRAKDKTAQMQARSGAIDELIASGALDDASIDGKDDITRELEQMSATSDVEAQLAQMKAQLGAGQAPAQLEPGDSTPTATPAETASGENATSDKGSAQS